MIPNGFAEICAIEHPPIVGRDHLANGAVVKYQGSQPIDTLVPNAETSVTLVHEFRARAGYGLSFRLAGSPDLNGKLWAIRPAWVIWLQYMGADRIDTLSPGSRATHLWHVGTLLEVRTLRELMQRMEPVHCALDRGIATEAGVFRAGKLPFDKVSEEATRALAPADTAREPAA